MRIFREKQSLRDHDGYPKRAHAAISGMSGATEGASDAAPSSAGFARLPQAVKHGPKKPGTSQASSTAAPPEPDPARRPSPQTQRPIRQPRHHE
jgi:hypothetical protein